VKCVTIRNITAVTAIELKNWLQDRGLVQGQDFEWRYCPSAWEGFEQTELKRAEFEFVNPAHATAFVLKWG
jgi:hypothetical protein